MTSRPKPHTLVPALVGAMLVSCVPRSAATAPPGPAPEAYAPAPAPPLADPALAEAPGAIGALDANDPGQRVLLAGMQIAFVEKRVFKGGCWDFVNAVYNGAGFPPKQRSVVFQGSRKGPFAKAELLKPGDWIMHVNHEAASSEHSSIFVKWIDFPRRVALALDYAGMNRPAPGRLSRHDYSQVFTALRPKAPKSAPAR